MQIREYYEAMEEKNLSEFACLSKRSKGREKLRGNVISGPFFRETEIELSILKHLGD